MALELLGVGFSQPAETQSLSAEVDTYPAVPISVQTDSISFWQVCGIFDLINTCLHCLQENQDAFPTLFRLAMDILPIQASSVPCERVFSSSKETITARRNSLGPSLVEALQLLKYATKKGRGISFVEGLEKGEECKELELREAGEPVEDLVAYLCNFQA
jgi:hAT family C-terminal dimerisation region